MKIANVLHNDEVISELHTRAANLRIERFCRQMPYAKYMDSLNKYTTHSCIGLGYTIGGEIVAIPDFSDIEKAVRGVNAECRGRTSEILQKINRDDTRIDVYTLYESSDFLRLDDGSLVGIIQGVPHDYFYIPLHSDPNRELDNFRIESIISNYNGYMSTKHPNWVIHTVGWFDAKSQ